MKNLKEIQIECFLTESPSLNICVTHDGRQIFYNSDRLQGGERARMLGKILDIKTLKIGKHDMKITEEQLVKILDIPSRL